MNTLVHNLLLNDIDVPSVDIETYVRKNEKANHRQSSITTDPYSVRRTCMTLWKRFEAETFVDAF